MTCCSGFCGLLCAYLLVYDVLYVQDLYKRFECAGTKIYILMREDHMDYAG